MREVKFRAWDDKRKQMYVGGQIESDCFITFSGKVVEPVIHGSDGIEMIYEQNLSIMQCTGIKDRNGKEIYESDIVAVVCDCDPGDYAVCTHPPLIAYVDWFQENASYELRDATGKLSGEEFTDDYQDVYEIIGNIYEHPERLDALTVSKQEESTVSEVACEQTNKDSLHVARQNTPTHPTQQINRLAQEVASDMQWRGERT